jgi:hypothetical protein
MEHTFFCRRKISDGGRRYFMSDYLSNLEKEIELYIEKDDEKF